MKNEGEWGTKRRLMPGSLPDRAERSLARKRVLPRLLGLIMLSLLAQGVMAQSEDVDYTGTITLESEEGDNLRAGEDAVMENQFLVHLLDKDGNGPEVIKIWFPPLFPTFYIEFQTQSGTAGSLGPGTNQFAFPKTKGIALLDIRPRGNEKCFNGKGVFTIVEAKFDKLEASGEWVATKFHATFEGECTTVPATAGFKGAVDIAVVEEGEGSGAPEEPAAPGDGGPEPPPPPPPPFVRIIAPVAGVALGSHDRVSVPISTTVHQGYEGEIHLEAFSGPGITAVFEPAIIASPGAGATVLTIDTSEWLLPMRHLIEIRASGPPRSTSFVMPIEVLCEPPFVRALDVPDEIVVPLGGMTELEIEAAGSGPLRYQWYEGPRGSTWRPIEGASGSRVSIGPINGTSHYWLRVTNGCGTWDSPAIRVANKASRARAVRK